MNLPISAVSSAVTGATKIVRQVAGGVGRALDFEAVLRNEPETASESLRNESISLIRDALAAIGVQVNPPLRLDVNQFGDIQLADEHPRAAEIELELTSNKEIQAAIRRLAAGGKTQLLIGQA